MSESNISYPDGDSTVTEANTSYQFSVTEPNNATLTQTNVAVPDGCIVLRLVTATDFIPWDNPHNLISWQVERLFDKFASAAMIILCLFGVPTNIINTIAFYRHGIRERINLCLFYLSVVDLLYAIFIFVYHADGLFLKVTVFASRGVMRGVMTKYALVGFYGLGYPTGFVTTVIACERCFCVVSPLKSQRILKTRTTAVIIIVVSLVMMAGFFVVGSRWDLKCIVDPLTGAMSYTVLPRDFYLRNRTLIDFLEGVVYGLILPAIIDIAVALTTIVTVIKLKTMAAWREATSSGAMSPREVALTRMLVGTSILFIACTTPPICFRCAILAVPDLSLSGRYYNMFNFLASLSKLMAVINSSVNFIIYYVMGSKFKDTVRSMFWRASAEKKTTADLKHSVISTKSEIKIT